MRIQKRDDKGPGNQGLCLGGLVSMKSLKVGTWKVRRFSIKLRKRAIKMFYEEILENPLVESFKTSFLKCFIHSF